MVEMQEQLVMRIMVLYGAAVDVALEQLQIEVDMVAAHGLMLQT